MEPVQRMVLANALMDSTEIPVRLLAMLLKTAVIRESVDQMELVTVTAGFTWKIAQIIAIFNQNVMVMEPAKMMGLASVMLDFTVTAVQQQPQLLKPKLNVCHLATAPTSMTHVFMWKWVYSITLTQW